MPDYYCAECGAEARVVGGQVAYSCKHEGARVIAPRTSVLYGQGGAATRPMSLYDRLVSIVSGRG